MRKKSIKLFRLILWKAFKLVPTGLKHKLIRSQFSVTLPVGVYSDIEYKIAETEKERQQALSLVQSSYVDSKLTNDEQALYRISKFNLLPTTIIFIAKYKGEVIATVSEILDSSLGLPIDSFTDLNRLRENGNKISEISCLAIDKRWRSRSSGVFFPLTVYAISYCRDVLGVDYAVMVTRASVRHFYTALYGFKPIENKVKKHVKVNQRSSFAQFLNLNKLDGRLRVIYKKKPLSQNLYYLIHHFPWRHQCDFVKRRFNIISNKHFTGHELDNLFLENPSLSDNISYEDRKNLASIYYYKNMAQIFSQENYQYVTKRKSVRFQVNMEIKCADDIYKVVEVSKFGFCVIGEPKECELKGIIFLNSEENCNFVALKCWSYMGRTGYEIQNISTGKWDEMIEFSESMICSKDSFSKDKEAA